MNFRIDVTLNSYPKERNELFKMIFAYCFTLRFPNTCTLAITGHLTFEFKNIL